MILEPMRVPPYAYWRMWEVKYPNDDVGGSYSQTFGHVSIREVLMSMVILVWRMRIFVERKSVVHNGLTIERRLSWLLILLLLVLREVVLSYYWRKRSVIYCKCFCEIVLRRRSFVIGPFHCRTGDGAVLFMTHFWSDQHQ